jgi:ferredoxin-type protein NapH
MANPINQAGREAREKLGWWHANRFLFWRRLSQLSILAMFLSGPWFSVWILRGNYSSSLLLDTIPL